MKKTSSTIAQQVAELSDLSRNMLTERWRSLYLIEPPHNSSRKFLRGRSPIGCKNVLSAASSI